MPRWGHRGADLVGWLQQAGAEAGTVDRRRVVEVLGARSGSGLLLADRLVLTAAHLLFPVAGHVLADERAAGEVTVRLADGRDEYAARCVWARYEGPDRGLDAALLEITGPGWELPGVAGMRVGRLAGSAEARVHAFGFPDADVRAGAAELSPVTGTVHTGSGARSGRPEIVVGGEPERGPKGESLWAGLSGGPVFAAPGGVTVDVLLGVIVGDPAEFASRRLRMIPAQAFLADARAAAIIERYCGSLAVISVPEPGPPAAGVRFTLPPDTAGFTGRAEELDRITAMVAGAAGAERVVAVGAVDGMPGVGKTALAVHVAHVLSARFPDWQLFIDLHAHTPGRQPVAPEDALAGLLSAAGVNQRFLPGDLDGRAAMWRDQMAGQRVLLVLDNAASSTQVAPLLPGGGNCLVLVTSRRHLGDLPGVVVPVSLDTLPAEQAEEMFTRLAPRATADPAGVAEVVRLAGYLPLAVSLLARVYARHQSWTLADLADETRDRLLSLKAEHQSIAAAFDVSYRHLDPALRRLFDLLGLHPGTTTDRYAAAALVGISLGEAGGLLDGLHGEGLVTETGHRRYGMHDLLRRYARDHAIADADGDQTPGRHPAAERETAVDRLLDYYQHTSLDASTRLARWTQPRPAGRPPAHAPDISGPDKARAWLRAERANLESCLHYAASFKRDDRTVALSAGLAWLLRTGGPSSQALLIHAAASAAAARLGDRPGQGNALVNLGYARILSGDYPGAVQDLQQAIDLFRHLGDRLGQASALSTLAQARRLTGDSPGAARDLQQACDLYQTLGDRLGQASALSYLGQVRRLTGDHADAARDLEHALGLFRALGDDLGQANALTETGMLRQTAGDYQGAAHDQTEALGLFRALGDDLGQANALTNLGVVQSLTGDYPGAERDLLQAHDLHVKLGNQFGQVNVQIYLGRVRMLTGDHGRAERDLRRALDSCRSLGTPLGQAITLTNLGRLSRLTRDLPAAAQYLQQALELSDEPAARSNRAHAQNQHAALLTDTGDIPSALAAYRDALRQAREARQPDNEATALEGIGECLLRTEDKADGIEYLRKALAAFQRLSIRPDAERVRARLAGISPHTGWCAEQDDMYMPHEHGDR